MALVNGIHHVATLTPDLDRLIAFYRKVFDASVLFDEEEDGLRHAFLALGPNTMLHPFQLSWTETPQGAVAMFARGRTDHFALNAVDEAAFWLLHGRAVAEGAAGPEVTDMGPILHFVFTDPDGAEHEVVWTKPDAVLDASSRREHWTTIAPKHPPTAGPSAGG